MSSTINVTVLVGNGFDLSAGLHTDTVSFIKEFAAQHDSDDGPIGELARRIKQDGPETWADFEIMLGEYTQQLEETSDDAVGAAVECKGAIDTALADFIGSEDSRISDEFIKENADSVISSLAFWHEALQPLERGAIERVFSKPFSLVIRFVTFNYTSLLPRIFEEFGQNGHAGPAGAQSVSDLQLVSLVQAHGSLNREPVCGVNDVSQIRSGALADNEDVCTTYIKGEIQQLFASDDNQRAVRAINAANVIIIFGLSLGESDVRWWIEVINFLKASEGHFVIVASTKANSSRKSATAYLHFVRQVKQRLLLHGGVDEEEFRELSKRVFIIQSDRILRFQENIAANDSGE